MRKIKYYDIKHDIGFCEGADGWCIDEIGNKHYFENGYMESIGDEPASIYINNTFDWRKKGLYHRIGGSAKIGFSGNIYYYEGKKHRIEGPAIIGGHRDNQWWINDFRLTEKEFNQLPKDNDEKFHSNEPIRFVGEHSYTTFLFWHGEFCQSLEEFNAKKLDAELPQKADNKTRFKI